MILGKTTKDSPLLFLRLYSCLQLSWHALRQCFSTLVTFKMFGRQLPEFPSHAYLKWGQHFNGGGLKQETILLIYKVVLSMSVAVLGALLAWFVCSQTSHDPTR